MKSNGIRFFITRNMTKWVYLVFGLLLLGISQISAISEESRKATIRALHNSCVKETGVDEQMITDCSSGIFAEDEKLKCYMKCLLVYGSILHEDTGEWNLKALEALLPEDCKEEAVPIINECGVVKGTDNCDTAFQTNKCWQSKAPEKYKLI